MVRNYKKKTNRGNIPIEVLTAAAEEVAAGMALRTAANQFSLDKMTLLRYINKSSQLEPGIQPKIGYAKVRQIFSDEQENELASYILHCSRIYYGLAPKEIRKVAFEYSAANKVTTPENWSKQNMASADWFSAFMKRHPRLSIRTPEATSLGRATSFNKFNVQTFFNNLKDVLDRYKFESVDIWNTDETGLQTVQRPGKIVGDKGKKQIGRVTSAERGTTVTMVLAVNACGNSVPPMLIFPRVFFKEHFVSNGPPNCVGAAHPSGWVTADSFLLFMKHFVRHVRCSKEKPCLLVLDNHSSHVAIKVIDYCSENGVVLLSFPPHTTHRLQPLDRSVFGPFKKYFFAACDRWMTSNAGKTISIYDIPPILKEALPTALTPTNILAGFKSTGIAPYNPDIFSEADFLCSAVTDRPLHNSNEENDLQNNLSENVKNNSATGFEEQNNNHNNDINDDMPSTSYAAVSPAELRPFPKAQPRIENRKYKKRKSVILTDTPEKEAIREEEQIRALKKKASAVKRNVCENTKGKSKLKSANKKIKPTVTKNKKENDSSSDEEDENCLCLVCLHPYSNSKGGEQWIQCTKCRRWAHLACGTNDIFYVCVNCQSDDDHSSDD